MNTTQALQKSATPQEIEKKFLIKSLPPSLEQYPCEQIRQGYLSVDVDHEIRVRQKDNHYFYTEKIGHGLARTEIEKEITPEEFASQWPQTAGRQVTKTRHKIAYQGRLIELDIYADSLLGLIEAEVEFPSLEIAKKFIPPSWFGREVTDNPRHRIGYLLTHGLPE